MACVHSTSTPAVAVAVLSVDDRRRHDAAADADTAAAVTADEEGREGLPVRATGCEGRRGDGWWLGAQWDFICWGRQRAALRGPLIRRGSGRAPRALFFPFPCASVAVAAASATKKSKRQRAAAAVAATAQTGQTG